MYFRHATNENFILPKFPRNLPAFFSKFCQFSDFPIVRGTPLTMETKKNKMTENENKLEQGAFLPQCNASHYVDNIYRK